MSLTVLVFRPSFITFTLYLIEFWERAREREPKEAWKIEVKKISNETWKMRRADGEGEKKSDDAEQSPVPFSVDYH